MQAAMDPVAVPFHSPVRCNAEVKDQEMNLANAVLAIDRVPTTASLCSADINTAIQTQFGSSVRPVNVTPFHFDFVIQLATRAQRDLVLSSEFLYGPDWNMILIPWSRTYKSRTVPAFAKRSSLADSPASSSLLDTAEEFGVDSDLLREAYEQQDRDEEFQNSRIHTQATTQYSSDSSIDLSEIDEHGWESDRSWKLFHGA